MAFPIAASPYPTATASPAYSGTFIPEIWSAKLLEHLYASTVLASIANTDYEGEIRNKGDKVVIRHLPRITVRDYSAEEELTFDRPGEANVELLIDKGKYFNIALDDVHRVQMDIDLLDKITSRAGEEIKIAIDTDVLAGMVAAADASNMGPNAGAISGNINLGDASASPTVPLNVTLTPSGANDVDPVDLLLRGGQVLDEQNVPADGRYAVIPSWMARYLKRSDIKDASLTGDSTSPLRNGRIGRIDRFEIYISNLLPKNTDEFYVFMGHKMALTFAQQISKIETLRSERAFATYLRGLTVYGYKVVKPEALAVAYCKAA